MRRKSGSQELSPLSLDQALTIAGGYASRFSSNASPGKPYGLDTETAEFMRRGYQAGSSGACGAAALLLLPLLISIIVALWILQVLFGIGACTSTTTSTISVAGLRFQVDDTDCDRIAKEEWVSVYVWVYR